MKNRFDGFIANEKQEKAFNKVISAMKAAKKLGLHFYGKQDILVACTTKANSYINDNGMAYLLKQDHEPIPYLTGDNVLSDSGADDYENFLEEDQEEWKEYINLLEEGEEIDE